MAKRHPSPDAPRPHYGRHRHAANAAGQSKDGMSRSKTTTTDVRSAVELVSVLNALASVGQDCGDITRERVLG
jgi:hypothetical protein